ncbi:MAG: sulfur reduction protein DsrS [gamma proteobacterium symbiont of Phacoides pectinatus]
MELSSEDALRLNVMLANRPLAIRIHESSMTLYGLLETGEASIRLNPMANPEKYLLAVRSFLSEKALGNPGGYPLYLQRWTRQGQMREQSLEQLLMLGDPTAVFAVVCAEGIGPEIARRAWWASQEPENARRLLQTRSIAHSPLGTELARFLVEYLPFETEPEQMIHSVAMAVQPGPLDQEQRRALWAKAARKTPYLVGFLLSAPDSLPAESAPRPDHVAISAALAGLREAGNPWAETLIAASSSQGQAFLDTFLQVMVKPPNQDVVALALDAVRAHLSRVRPEGDPDLDYPALVAEAAEYAALDRRACECVDLMPGLRGQIESLRILSGLGYGVLRPVLRDSTAIGSLMRKKLLPLTTPLGACIARLLRATA